MIRSCVLIAGLAAAQAGCFGARPSVPESFVWQFARNATQQPLKHRDDKHFIHVVRERAEAAYKAACGRGARHSDPFHDGFVDGFIDYVEAGGTGEPPYLPPFRYRLTKYRTADGGVAVAEAWYAGFREGSAAARASGLRELNFVPLPGPAVTADVRVAEPPVALPAPSGRSPWEVPGSVAPPRVEPAPKTLPPPQPLLPLPIPPAVPGAAAAWRGPVVTVEKTDPVR